MKGEGEKEKRKTHSDLRSIVKLVMVILRRQSVPFFSRKSPVIPLFSDKLEKDHDTGERMKMSLDGKGGKGGKRGRCGNNEKVLGEELAIVRVFTVVRRGLWRMRIEENK